MAGTGANQPRINPAMPCSLDQIATALHNHPARRIPGRRWVRRCGVVLLLADSDPSAGRDEPVLLMMTRAERHGDPWSGHVSFPGGRVARDDASTRAAALRELQEETGFDPEGSAEPIGRLSDLLTREHSRPLPMVVSPYVYRIPRALVLKPGIEAAELHWVPLSWLADPLRRQTLIWKVAGLRLPAPCIDLGGARLWGLSLMMTRELLRVARQAEKHSGVLTGPAQEQISQATDAAAKDQQIGKQ